MNKIQLKGIIKEELNKVLKEDKNGKIITYMSKEKDIDVNDIFRNYKYAIPEMNPKKLSNGTWLHVYKVTNYSKDAHGDFDEESDAYDREMYD